MFESTTAFSGFAVDDTERARKFYGETLGVPVTDGEEPGLLVLNLAGNRPTLIYPKPDFVPATYTILNFQVDDIDATVAELTRRGVAFERYEGTPMETDATGVFRKGGPPIAWFTDPAGNILSVIQAS